MAAETQYTAKTGMVTISQANSNLDGSGSLGTLITGGSNGTLIKKLYIKAQTNTTHGMIRLFLYNGTNTRLIKEIEIQAVTKSASHVSYECTLRMHLYLKSGWTLKVSTEKAETFNIIAEAQDWSYHTTSVRPETTRYTINNKSVTISTANPNLDGTGSISTAITSSGSNIFSISIKSQQDTNVGMIRLFLKNATSVKLFKEIPVEAIKKSSKTSSFHYRLIFDGFFALQNEWEMKVSTENAEIFNIITESFNWTYPA